MNQIRQITNHTFTLAVILLCGCNRWFVDDADRQVYRLIEQRQEAALGETHSAHLGDETGEIGAGREKYSFVPHPIDPDVPESFKRIPVSQPTQTSDLSMATSAPSDIERQPFTLADCLSYAMGHAREFQTAKEDLYLAALALTLERHLWTPQFVSSVSSEFADYGQIRDFDRAMTAVAEIGATQRLPYGGQVTAQVIHTLMRDLGVHTTSGETGQAILTADIPLFRGAGRVAYESRYQAERDLIYAVRDFEEFRRSFLVEISSDFFDLLVSKAQIENAEASVEAFAIDLERAQAMADAERILLVEADRARVEYLRARNDAVTAREAYDSALDRFKIRLGMAAETPIDAVFSELDLFDPEVAEDEAIDTALRYRLDLLNRLDAVDDSRRQVLVAQNNLLPQFDLSGSATLDTDPTHLNSAGYNTERTTWRGSAELEVPLDRKEERNAYRSSLIDLRRAERAYEEAADLVRVDVRSALRRLQQAKSSMDIQAESIKINEVRREMASVQFEVGKLASNRDKIEAENDLRAARNAYAAEVSNYRRAILEFLRDTGTLRVGDDGKWIRPMAATAVQTESE